MLKNLKRAASIALSFAMAIQFGLADSYRVNAVEEATDSTIVESANTNETVEQVHHKRKHQNLKQ